MQALQQFLGHWPLGARKLGNRQPLSHNNLPANEADPLPWAASAWPTAVSRDLQIKVSLTD